MLNVFLRKRKDAQQCICFIIVLIFLWGRLIIDVTYFIRNSAYYSWSLKEKKKTDDTNLTATLMMLYIIMLCIMLNCISILSNYK